MASSKCYLCGNNKKGWTPLSQRLCEECTKEIKGIILDALKSVKNDK